LAPSGAHAAARARVVARRERSCMSCDVLRRVVGGRDRGGACCAVGGARSAARSAARDRAWSGGRGEHGGAMAVRGAGIYAGGRASSDHVADDVGRCRSDACRCDADDTTREVALRLSPFRGRVRPATCNGMSARVLLTSLASIARRDAAASDHQPRTTPASRVGDRDESACRRRIEGAPSGTRALHADAIDVAGRPAGPSTHRPRIPATRISQHGGISCSPPASESTAIVGQPRA
jgi:hypothetical protein